MNINELIETLQDVRDNHGDDIDVRIASQPRWPFELEIGEIQDEPIIIDGSKKVLYLPERRQIGYLPDEARDIFSL